MAAGWRRAGARPRTLPARPGRPKGGCGGGGSRRAAADGRRGAVDRVGEVPDRYLSDEQRLMRETCRRYVDEVVRPFIEANREREWLFDPSQRLPPGILEEADRTGLRGLGVLDQYGGVGLDPAKEAQTFSIIATEIARGDSGLADKLVQNWKI